MYSAPAAMDKKKCNRGFLQQTDKGEFPPSRMNQFCWCNNYNMFYKQIKKSSHPSDGPVSFSRTILFFAHYLVPTITRVKSVSNLVKK